MARQLLKPTLAMCIAALLVLWAAPRVAGFLVDLGVPAEAPTPQEPMSYADCFHSVESIWIIQASGHAVPYTGELVDRLQGTTWQEMADIAREVCR